MKDDALSSPKMSKKPYHFFHPPVRPPIGGTVGAEAAPTPPANSLHMHSSISRQDDAQILTIMIQPHFLIMMNKNHTNL